MTSSPEQFLKAFAAFLGSDPSRRVYVYAGYTGGVGSLLVKVKESEERAVMKPWLRGGPVGLQDIRRSEDRFGSFRGQLPDVHVHLASAFRENARSYAQTHDSLTLVALDSDQRLVTIFGFGHLPEALRATIVEFCTQIGFLVRYGPDDTRVHPTTARGPDPVDPVRSRGARPQVAARARGEPVSAPREPAAPALTAFISYSWDSESHSKWVFKLAADLMRNGIEVLVDFWDLKSYRGDLNLFMEAGIRESDFVILVCTPTYAERANQRKGGVGAESTIITGEIYSQENGGKYIPILRGSGGPEKCLPSYLRSRLATDFSDDAQYENRLEELLRRLFDMPRYRKPSLGRPPQLLSEDI